MRSDMAKVVTERPRRGHGNPSKKWGRRLRRNQYDAEDHGPNRAPTARRNQYGWNAKEFSDLLGPLRRYLRKQVGRPWDKVWSEITRNLDSRSLTGQHIFDHIKWEVAQHVLLRQDGSLYRARWSEIVPVSGSVRSPDYTTALLRRRVLARLPRRPVLEGSSCPPKVRYRRLQSSRHSPLSRRRHASVGTSGGRLVHSHLPLRARAARSSDHSERRARGPDLQQSCYERAATKQASKKEIRDARRLLERDPLCLD